MQTLPRVKLRKNGFVNSTTGGSWCLGRMASRLGWHQLLGIPRDAFYTLWETIDICSILDRGVSRTHISSSIGLLRTSRHGLQHCSDCCLACWLHSGIWCHGSAVGSPFEGCLCGSEWPWCSASCDALPFPSRRGFDTHEIWYLWWGEMVQNRSALVSAVPWTLAALWTHSICHGIQYDWKNARVGQKTRDLQGDYGNSEKFWRTR